jgi:DNA-binding NtrC family response regulator
VGILEEADGGTLFLDEVAALEPRVQVQLLRFLDSGAVQPIGGASKIVDVRVVAASNADFEQEMKNGSFRPDLYKRLAWKEIVIPPLRDRIEDLPLLFTHFLRRERALDLPISRTLMIAMLHHRWPWNVRELMADVAAMVADSRLRPEDPKIRLTADLERRYAAGADRGGDGKIRKGSPRTLEQLEQAIRAAGGDKKAAAQANGWSLPSVYRWLKELPRGE